MPAGITLAEARKLFAEELGNCDENSDRVLRKITSALEFTVLKGGGNILREWCVIARNGKFTLPRDLETPLKFKFARLPNYGFGTFRSEFFSYSSHAVKETCGFSSFQKEAAIRPGLVATQFEPPRCGVHLIVIAEDDRDKGVKVIAGGKWRGKDIEGIHEGSKTAGEVLTAWSKKEKPRRSTFKFDEVTSFIKDPTCGWITLIGEEVGTGKQHFLGHYHPDDEVCVFRQAEMFTWPTTCCDCRVSILGKINPSIEYKRDEDVLPLTSYQMLEWLAKRARYEDSGNLNEVDAYEKRIEELIRDQVAYQKAPSGREISYHLPSSGGSMTNV